MLSTKYNLGCRSGGPPLFSIKPGSMPGTIFAIKISRTINPAHYLSDFYIEFLACNI
jgi:hypothetical protein